MLLGWTPSVHIFHTSGAISAPSQKRWFDTKKMWSDITTISKQSLTGYLLLRSISSYMGQTKEQGSGEHTR